MTAEESETPRVNEANDIANEAAAEAVQEAADESAARIAALEEQLANAQQETLYAKAEVQNVRRRAEKEVADAHAYSATKFARDILSVADNIGRALDAIPAAAREDEAWKGLVTGLEATGRELSAVFERNGITRIDSVGQPLDPNLHQAMMEIPSTDAAPGTVIQEIQSGYMIKDRLLRPALVGVAKAG
ncbi:nucleotide exchange factor GrpE [Sphingomonas lacunae]|uniref:Protein GrpE n=1 Tax=Sphingomonas lacunae TaxID=2698828 RepID=A0A6M4AY05_9SPHN|nr:nucleotide exchange factor GrpE [Sphingomonas lacunae]QJQ33262.1 nucleotide exchange factor GrpE [Sphingomonas lacunae]